MVTDRVSLTLAQVKSHEQVSSDVPSAARDILKRVSKPTLPRTLSRCILTAAGLQNKQRTTSRHETSSQPSSCGTSNQLPVLCCGQLTGWPPSIIMFPHIVCILSIGDAPQDLENEPGPVTAQLAHVRQWMQSGSTITARKARPGFGQHKFRCKM